MSLMWRCNICDLTMQVISRSSHLAGRRHAAKAASTGPAEWKCTVCRRTMDKNSKQPHLSGKAHAKMMKASRISAESGTVPEQPKEPPRAAKSGNPRTQAEQLNSQAVVAFKLQDFYKAIELFTEAISLDAGVAPYYTNRGVAYSRARNYIPALADFNAATTLTNGITTVKILVHMARCRLFLGSPSSALLSIQDALCLDPTNSDVHVLKKSAVELQGHMDSYKDAIVHKRWQMARTSYESCLRVYAQEDGNPPIEVQCWEIEILIAEKDWDAVVTATRTLKLKQPQATETMLIDALVLFLTDHCAEAVAQLTALLKMDPDNQRAQMLRSRAKILQKLDANAASLYQSGRWSDAVAKWGEVLQQVAERQEEGCGGLVRARILHDRAMAFTKLERYPEGIKDLNLSLELNPTYFKALRARGQIFATLELYEPATEDFTHALEHGMQMMSAFEQCELKDELEEVKLERDKGKDYYKILGLSPWCTSSEIRKAYLAQSRRHHPDKGGVAEKFKIITEAYTVLFDDTARQDYDFAYP